MVAAGTNKQTPIMAQYNAVKAQYPDCLIFFRLGDFYELFYDDAKTAAAALDIVLTARHKNTADEVPMCGVPAHASENYIAKLVRKGYRVAICEQMEKPSHKAGKGPVRREVVRVVTAGTLTEEALLDARAHNFLMAVYPEGGGHLDQTMVGVAFVDISTGDFFVESCSGAGLANVLERVQPQEILVPEPMMQAPCIDAIWSTHKQRIHPIALGRFDMGDRRLSSFFQVHTLESFGEFMPREVAAAGAVLDYLLVTQKRHVLMVSRPRKLETTQFVQMDAFTRRSLEMTHTFAGQRQGSLLDAVDMTVSPMGARLLAWRLTHPVKDLALIEQRLASVAYGVASDKRRAVREILGAMPDLERALGRLMSGRGQPRDFGVVRAVLMACPCMVSLFPDTASMPDELRKALHVLTRHHELCDILQRALVADLPVALRQGPLIAPGYDTALDECRHGYAHSQEMLQTLQDRLVQETQINTLKIRHNAIIGYYIEVSTAAAAKVPFDFVLKQSLVAGCRYTTPELMALEQRLVGAQDKAWEIEARLIGELEEMIERACPALKEVVRSLAVWDVSAALAELAYQHKYVAPQLDHSRVFEVVGGRHPIVERHVSQPFVKNDCVMQAEKPLWVMTGPNMAGKSTFLRQNALIVLLAHIGSFVPADRAHIGLVDRIFSRVGASDDLARGHSTFMVEMVETATILNQATVNSFVILDEVGRGTSTFDGLALAWACVEHMAQVLRCRALFATHYHELSQLRALPGVDFFTLKIQEWENNIVFFHKVIAGVSDRSYGIHVARLAGLPEAIVHRAEALLQQFEQKSPGVDALSYQLDSCG